jgi:hypothetical protein
MRVTATAVEKAKRLAMNTNRGMRTSRPSERSST